MQRFDRRVSQLEHAQGEGWRGWAGVPMTQWPDAALHAYLGAELSMTVEAVAAMPDTDLWRITGAAQ